MATVDHIDVTGLLPWDSGFVIFWDAGGSDFWMEVLGDSGDGCDPCRIGDAFFVVSVGVARASLDRTAAVAAVAVMAMPSRARCQRQGCKATMR